jgi:hypothetical protein
MHGGRAPGKCSAPAMILRSRAGPGAWCRRSDARGTDSRTKETPGGERQTTGRRSRNVRFRRRIEIQSR